MSQDTVLIAGASRGIGEACCRAFAENGWNVVGVGRSPAPAKTSAHLWLQHDLTQNGAPEAAVDGARKRFGRLDAVVHSVGVLKDFVPTKEVSWERWQDMLLTSLGTAIGLIRAASPSLEEAGTNGTFTFVSSIARQMPFPGGADYSAAKAALSNLAISVARDLAPTGGRANAVEPAVVDTEMIDSYRHLEPHQWHLLQRIGDPKEIGDFVHYLASPKAKWLTGQFYTLDGGLLSTPPGQ